jgi:hypothetical protein
MITPSNHPLLINESLQDNDPNIKKENIPKQESPEDVQSCLTALENSSKFSLCPSAEPIKSEEEEEEKIFEWNICLEKENVPPNLLRDIDSNEITKKSNKINIQSISVGLRSEIIETDFLYENMQEVESIVSNTFKKIKTLHMENEKIPPYDKLKIDDQELIDSYLNEFMTIEKKYKKVLTGKKIKAENAFIHPLPSEVLDKYKKLNKNFKVNFHHNPAPTKKSQTGYCYRVVCEYLKMNDFYKVNDRKQLPSCKLREYISQKILKVLYPNLNTWLELLSFLKFNI